MSTPSPPTLNTNNHEPCYASISNLNPQTLPKHISDEVIAPGPRPKEPKTLLQTQYMNPLPIIIILLIILLGCTWIYFLYANQVSQDNLFYAQAGSIEGKKEMMNDKFLFSHDDQLFLPPRDDNEDNEDMLLEKLIEKHLSASLFQRQVVVYVHERRNEEGGQKANSLILRIFSPLFHAPRWFRHAITTVKKLLITSWGKIFKHL